MPLLQALEKSQRSTSSLDHDHFRPNPSQVLLQNTRIVTLSRLELHHLLTVHCLRLVPENLIAVGTKLQTMRAEQ